MPAAAALLPTTYCTLRAATLYHLPAHSLPTRCLAVSLSTTRVRHCCQLPNFLPLPLLVPCACRGFLLYNGTARASLHFGFTLFHHTSHYHTIFTIFSCMAPRTLPARASRLLLSAGSASHLRTAPFCVLVLTYLLLPAAAFCMCRFFFL